MSTDTELTNLATVAEYMHGAYLSDAHKVTRSFGVMSEHYTKNNGFELKLSYYITYDLQTAYKEISPRLNGDLSNLDAPELQTPLAPYMPSGNKNAINTYADLIKAVLPADGKMNLNPKQKADAYKFLVSSLATNDNEVIQAQEKKKAMDEALRTNNSEFIEAKFAAVINVLFEGEANHQKALEKMAKHPGLNCTGCEIQQNMQALDAKKPSELKTQLEGAKSAAIK